MSVKAVRWVLAHSKSRGLARLVLITLAEHLNEKTGQCNPPQRLVAQEAGIGNGSVPNAIAELVALGEIIEIKGGPRRPTRYVFPLLERSPAERSRAEHDSAQEMSAALSPGVSAALTEKHPDQRQRLTTGKNQKEPSPDVEECEAMPSERPDFDRLRVAARRRLETESDDPDAPAVTLPVTATKGAR